MSQAGNDLRAPLNLEGEFDPRSPEEWRTAAEKGLGPGGLERLVVEVAGDVTVGPLYTEHDASATESYPGLRPFTRGSRPLGNVTDGWEICQRVDLSVPAEIGVLAAEEARGGATGLWISRTPADGLKNRVGDMEPLATAVDPTETAIRLDGGAVGFASAAIWVAACTRQGIELSRLEGSFGWDPLGSLASVGELPHDLETALAMASELARWTHGAAPAVRAISVDTLPHHLAGADPVQELAIATATGVEYLRRIVADGMDVDAACGQIGFVTAIGRDLFTEVAKLRALRRLWSRVAEVSGAGPDCPSAPIHAVTSPRCLSRRDPWVNMLRTTVEAFAAAAGGADAITVLPFDTALGRPDQQGRRMARNAHAVMMEESHLHRIVDPAGGSYLVEHLTDRLARAAWAGFQEIEGRGGDGVRPAVGLRRRTDRRDRGPGRRRTLRTPQAGHRGQHVSESGRAATDQAGTLNF